MSFFCPPPPLKVYRLRAGWRGLNGCAPQIGPLRCKKYGTQISFCSKQMLSELQNMFKKKEGQRRRDLTGCLHGARVRCGSAPRAQSPLNGHTVAGVALQNEVALVGDRCIDARG